MTEPRRNLDPKGKRALFETPVTAADDVLRAGEQADGRAALFSTGRPRPGTALVECSSCATRTRVTLGDIAVRLASFSVYLPLLHPRHPHRIRCPHCAKTSWCRIGWGE
ncbi:hypothetical protein [Actinospongicola halichondriae]|uniref:hypothetical protein n=1 Tax=Actinospongicola halichondriae TaxID=3236844 RepID=UPI003D3BCB01